MRLPALLTAVLLTGCASAPAVPPAGPPAPVEIPALPPHAGPLVSPVTFGLVFDPPGVTAAQLAVQHFVWAENRGLGPVAGVELGQYSPAYRASRAHDLTWFQANHPDWIAYLADRKTPAVEFGHPEFVPLDIANPAVIAFKQTEIAAARRGQDWVSLDNVDLISSYKVAGHFNAAGGWVQQYTGAYTDPAWRADTASYVAAMTAWAHAAGRRLMINNTDGASRAELAPAAHIALARLADGSMSEGFPIDGCYAGHGWAAGRPVDDQFAAEYEEVAGESAAHLFMVAYLCGHEIPTPAEQAWSVAAYLLAVRDPAINFLSVTSPAGATAIHDYPASMKPPIGAPIDPPPAAGAWPYVRRFQGGIVILNASSTKPATLRIPAGAWTDQFGVPVPSGSRALAPASALILIAKAS